MKNIKNSIILASVLLLPINTTKPITTAEKAALWGCYGLLVSIPIIYGIHHYYAKRKLSQRPVEQVKNEALSYFDQTKTQYKTVIDLFDKIEKGSEIEKTILSRNFIEAAHKMNLKSRYSLIAFAENLKSIEDELNLHKKWIDERIKIISEQQHPDPALSTELNVLKTSIENYIILNSNMHVKAVTSFEYQQQKLMMEAEARANAHYRSY